ncbi:MAG: DUF1796 family putative cysteine peptidase [Patescibacteria group bacterium]
MKTTDKQILQPYSYFFAKGRELLSQGLFVEAINVYHDGIKSYPSNPFAHFALGNVYSIAGNYSQGLNFLEKALYFDTLNSNLNLNQINENHKLLTLNDKQFYNVCQKIVDTAINLKQTQNLLFLINQASKRIDDSSFYLQIARKLSKQGEFEETIAFLNKAKELKKTKINNVKHQQSSGSSEHEEIEYLLTSLKQAQQNKILLQDRHYKIISLGYDCLPRTVATFWGLKPRKKSGELTCPFDLSLHPYESVIEAIETDFSNYLNPSFLTSHLVEKSYDESEKFVCIKNTHYNCIFSHERREEFRNNNFAKLIDLYRTRINNFYQYLNSSPVLFIIHCKQNLKVEPLIQVLSNKFPRLKFKIMLILSGEKIAMSSLHDSEHTIIHHIPCSNEYKWTQFSNQRIIFEQNIAEVIKQVILDFF